MNFETGQQTQYLKSVLEFIGVVVIFLVIAGIYFFLGGMSVVGSGPGDNFKIFFFPPYITWIIRFVMYILLPCVILWKQWRFSRPLGFETIMIVSASTSVMLLDFLVGNFFSIIGLHLTMLFFLIVFPAMIAASLIYTKHRSNILRALIFSQLSLIAFSSIGYLICAVDAIVFLHNTKEIHIYCGRWSSTIDVNRMEERDDEFFSGNPLINEPEEQVFKVPPEITKALLARCSFSVPLLTIYKMDYLGVAIMKSGKKRKLRIWGGFQIGTPLLFSFDDEGATIFAGIMEQHHKHCYREWYKTQEFFKQ